MSDEVIPLCGICGDACAENVKPSPWSGALLCHDCSNEEPDPDDWYHGKHDREGGQL